MISVYSTKNVDTDLWNSLAPCKNEWYYCVIVIAGLLVNKHKTGFFGRDRTILKEIYMSYLAEWKWHHSTGYWLYDRTAASCSLSLEACIRFFRILCQHQTILYHKYNKASSRNPLEVLGTHIWGGYYPRMSLKHLCK